MRVDAHREIVTAQPIGVEVAGRVMDYVPHPAADGVEGARVMRGVASTESWPYKAKQSHCESTSNSSQAAGVEATGVEYELVFRPQHPSDTPRDARPS
jgi:hypothetical protein